MTSQPTYAGNLFQGIPDRLQQELFTSVLETSDLKVERIVSRGHRCAENEWYDQAHDEWVLLLQGAARLAIQDQPGLIHLEPGDHCLLPAHCKHRVEWTPGDRNTIWLAIHY